MILLVVCSVWKLLFGRNSFLMCLSSHLCPQSYIWSLYYPYYGEQQGRIELARREPWPPSPHTWTGMSPPTRDSTWTGTSPTHGLPIPPCEASFYFFLLAIAKIRVVQFQVNLVMFDVYNLSSIKSIVYLIDST
jgi:hypothetical protein